MTYHSWTASLHNVSLVDQTHNTINFTNPMNSHWNAGGTSSAGGSVPWTRWGYVCNLIHQAPVPARQPSKAHPHPVPTPPTATAT